MPRVDQGNTSISNPNEWCSKALHLIIPLLDTVAFFPISSIPLELAALRMPLPSWVSDTSGIGTVRASEKPHRGALLPLSCRLADSVW